MRPGPTIIRQCAHCGKRIREHTAASGNSGGARLWTDIKCWYPMWPERLQLVQCPHCRERLWLDEQKQVGEVPPWVTPGMRAAYEDAERFLEPAAEDYLAALATCEDDPDLQWYLRLHAWWVGNDVRRGGVSDIPLSTEETANLSALVELLDETDDYERLLKAEAFRKLGRYDEVLALLAAPFSSRLQQTAETIETLSRLKEPYVRELPAKRRGLLCSTIFISASECRPK